MGGAQLIPYCVTFPLLQMAWYESFQGSKHCNPAQIWNRWVPHGVNALIIPHKHHFTLPSADVWQARSGSNVCVCPCIQVWESVRGRGGGGGGGGDVVANITSAYINGIPGTGVKKSSLASLCPATAFVNNSRGSSTQRPIPTHTRLKRAPSCTRAKTHFPNF